MTETNIDDLLTELRNLQIRVAQLEADQQREPPSTDRESKGQIQIGDRVKIKNKIRKPTNWPSDKAWTEKLERQATVTKVTEDRVYITTKNGTLTWRHPNNLRKIDN
jgi:hypothetical protein